MVEQITKALIEYKKNGKYISEEFTNFEPLKKTRVRIEDLLQIFVDENESLLHYLKHVIETYGERF